MPFRTGSGWWVALLGWPALFFAAGVFWLAWARKSRPAAIAGCALAAPTFLYLSLTPRFQWIAPPAFGLLCVLAWRMGRCSRLAAGLLALPAVAILLWLIWAGAAN